MTEITSNTTETVAPASTPTGLTIQDLTLALQVLQVATSRGAFKADELTAIGGLYDRIFKFLESTGAITTTPAQPQAETAAEGKSEDKPTAPAKPKKKAAAAK